MVNSKGWKIGKEKERGFSFLFFLGVSGVQANTGTSKHREKQNGKECGVQACERREAKHKGTGASLAL